MIFEIYTEGSEKPLNLVWQNGWYFTAESILTEEDQFPSTTISNSNQ